MIVKVLLLLCAIYTALADPVYQLRNLVRTDVGYTGDLHLESGSSGPYGRDIKNLKFELTLETDTRLRMRIVDRDSKRWEVPNVVRTGRPTSAPKNPKYTVDFRAKPFGFEVKRFPSREVIFSTLNTPFVYSDQFITIGTTFPKAQPHLYGFGERAAPLRLETDDSRYTMFNLDNTNTYKENLYGSHPFFMEFRNHSAYGVFLLNSNAQDVIIKDTPRPTLNLITIGGVIDLFFFLGPQPSDVIQQYHQVIGTPFLPPFWSLGWHQCRYGYKSLAELQTVVNKYKENELPLDTIWSDIDYMQDYKDFTWDKTRYPQDQVKSFVDTLHKNNQQYMVIVDPGIHAENGYAPYEDGIAQDVFIKKADNKTIAINKVWPGYCAFPDFTHPNTEKYWDGLVGDFLNDVPIDGLWLDMNEQACFCEGEGPCPPEPLTPDDSPSYIYNFTITPKRDPLPGFDAMYPPYTPGSQYNRTLSSKSLRPDTLTHLGLQYDVHNLYGLYQINSTARSLQKYRDQKRAMILTRGNFVGMGSMAAHWTGDNWSSWLYLRLSISGILNMQLFGIQFVGSDICGFLNDTTYELCSRWTQVGSLYPFSRNHNGLNQRAQEPYVFGGEFTAMARTHLNLRYSLLFYMYTQFFMGSINQGTVWRPLFVEFPQDDEANTAHNDAQFLVGPSLLCSPVLTQGHTSVKAYFPGTDGWYDYYTGQFVSRGRQTLVLNAPWDFLPLHVRGGRVIVKNTPALTSAETRKKPISLLVAINSSGAKGGLYLDDGESLETIENNKYTFVSYKAEVLKGRNHVRLLNNVQNPSGYVESQDILINEIVFYGIVGHSCRVEQKGELLPFHIGANNVLTVSVRVGVQKSLDITVLCVE
ncbi:lysosomal alpha-glucosidase [Acrasis kona]|uniref:Maltase n=1 Tax=Acrasis kona TaxID=1008807 RepID=A0AAW2Z270_9EUKA